MKHEELGFSGLVEVGESMASGALSPVELTEAMLERIEQVDPTIKSYARVMTDQAMEDAKRAETELKAGKRRGPLHGVPVAVKDLCDTKGVVTAFGVAGFQDRIPERDSTVVSKLRDAGAVILGKLEMTEAALITYDPGIAPPIDPWREDTWCGCSSSGSGVATAAGLCFGSLGSDTGGSIRFPAYCNGVVGLKPTWGRVSRYGVVPLAETLDHVGPLTRKVEDAAAMLGAIAGRDENDPTSLSDSVPDYLSGLGQGVKGIRIGYDEQYCTNGVEPSVQAATQRMIDILKERGAEIVPVTMPATEDAIQAWGAIINAEALLAHTDMYAARPSAYSEALKEFLETAKTVTTLDLAKATITRREFCGQIAALFQSVDLFVAPVMATAAPSLKDFNELCEQPTGLTELAFFSSMQNLTGSPTITLPGGLDANGRPVGCQLVGRHVEEGLLLRAGKAYQDDFTWPNRPPLAM